MSSSTTGFVSFAFLLPRSEKLAADQLPWKQMPGCSKVRKDVATTTITPSRTINEIWLLASGPRKPPESSATRNTDRTKMVRVARQRPHRKAVNILLRYRSTWLSDQPCGF